MHFNDTIVVWQIIFSFLFFFFFDSNYSHMNVQSLASGKELKNYIKIF